MKRLTLLLAFFGLIAQAVERPVRTFDELRQALAGNSRVETIRIEGEIFFTEALNVTRRFRLCGTSASRTILRRATSYRAGTLFVLDSPNSDLALSNLVIDGNKQSGTCTERLLRVSAGRLSLGRGCVVRNFRTCEPGTMTVGGGELILEEGASIVGLENDVYGVAVMASGAGVFTMLGGRISKCKGHWRGKPDLARGYDGAVYVYGGTFRALGGLITDNASEESVAGVNVYSGKIEMGGNFSCLGNAGKYADNISCAPKGGMVVRTDFCGKTTVRFPEDPKEGALVPAVKTSARYGLCPGTINLKSEASPLLVADLASSVTQMWHATWRKRNDVRARAAHTLQHLLSEVRKTPDPLADKPSQPREKVLFDTDIGTDVDDAFALAYLLAEPRCELMGITTCFGSPELRAELASAICTAFGRADIPIHPGRDRPLTYPREPTPPAQVKALGDEPRRKFTADGSAAEFLSRTIRANPGEITLVTVGPFMNLAELYRLDPEALKLLKRLVVMGGKFFAPKPSPEWNCMCDPDAAAISLGPECASRIPATYLHGLDVTERTTRTPAELVTLCRQIRALGCIDGVVTDFFRRHAYYVHCGKAMHDPLACVSVFYPELCQYSSGSVLVTPNERGATTAFSIAATGSQYAAKSVDADKFYRIFLRTLDSWTGPDKKGME